jgi:hypothetical protein
MCFYLDNLFKKYYIVRVPEKESATGGGGSGLVRKASFAVFPVT